MRWSFKFCTRSVKSWFKYNAFEVYPVNKEEKSVVPELFIRTLKSYCKYIRSMNLWLPYQKMFVLINYYKK